MNWLEHLADEHFMAGSGDNDTNDRMIWLKCLTFQGGVRRTSCALKNKFPARGCVFCWVS